MILDYGTQLSPLPIEINIGKLRKPKLRDIAEITFDKFNFFKLFLELTPENYYTKLKKDDNTWGSMTDKEKDELNIFDIISKDEYIRKIYVELLNFFFVETVVYQDELFILLKHEVENINEITIDNISGAISKDNFSQITKLIQQICCIYNNEEDEKEMKFKNNAAKKIYEKILKANKKKQTKKKNDINYTIPNIISSVSSMHPSINLINVWDLTVFQLIDTFNRLQRNTIFGIESRRVSVWGDEKKVFDETLWYKNEYDKI